MSYVIAFLIAVAILFIAAIIQVTTGYNITEIDGLWVLVVITLGASLRKK